ncbi:adenosylcobinamide-GDP ribazoletransferase [Microvirga terricola]|uniref:Adenosylcobinamide-GDP ribazoletransferase n=1 Tax=Microvirga terricola TaxID=2719797 RepID=A0ABX0VCQ1_9HYPH|nr:adenosylcobinamide-GDP ribazoletransferase [Microvirga terricola]NIX76939.1 adenosylcobinamide-GDP ribazoletransferase [Microvirga terricola]
MSDQLQKAQTAATTRAWQELLTDLARCLRFYSRLPVSTLPWEHDPHALPEFQRLTRVLPVAGLVLGLLPALVLALALFLDLGPWLAAILSIAAMTLTTGAFHEDGLTDTADSFGGATRERRLAIMKDSLIGSYGASALILAFALRIGALAALADRLAPLAACIALLIVASLSRTAGLMPLVLLPPARPDGASQAVGQPTRDALWLAAAIASLLAVVLGMIAGLAPSGVGLMIALSALSGLALTRFAARHIGGQTGDIAGAAQQVAEIAALIGLLTVTAP